MDMEWEEYQRIRRTAFPETPNEILGVSANANLAEIERAYENHKQRIEDEMAEGRKGDGGRIVPDKEFEKRLAELGGAREKLLAEAKDESEIPTAELDPDFPKRFLQ